MSESTGGEGSKTKIEGSKGKSETVTNDEHQKVLDQLAQMKSTNSRLLGENKEKSESIRVIKDGIDSSAKKKLEDEGKTQELLELERNNVFKLNEQIKDRSKRELQKDLEIEVARYASDAHDLKDVVAALDLKSLSIDPENGEVGEVKEAVAKVREEKSYMFKLKETPNTINTRPHRIEDKGPSQADKYASAVDFLVSKHTAFQGESA